MSDAPVTAVVVFEDRAELTRQIEIELVEGAQRIVLEGVTALTSAQRCSARVESLEGTDVAVEIDELVVSPRLTTLDDEGARRAQRHTLAEAAQAKVERLSRDADRAQARLKAADVAIARYAAMTCRAVWDPDAQPAVWGSSFDALEAMASAAAERAVDAERLRAEAVVEQSALVGSPGALSPGDRRLVADIEIGLTAEAAGRYRLTVSSVVPCVVWRPAHRLVLAGEVASWTVQGTLWQATGEDWRGVDLTFSTDRPGAGAQLPTLEEEPLRTQPKAVKKRVVLAHRQDAIAKDGGGEAVPGVDDGGETRIYSVDHPVDVAADGRPRRFDLSVFESTATLQQRVMPEVDETVFLEASLLNTGSGPLLAGPVVLERDGARIGDGDVCFVGVGETIEIVLGAVDHLRARYRRHRKTVKRVMGKDQLHFVHEVELSSTGARAERVEVVFRMPVSELEALTIEPSEQWCSEGAPSPDEDGIVRHRVEVNSGSRRLVELGFRLVKKGEIVLPDPW